MELGKAKKEVDEQQYNVLHIYSPLDDSVMHLISPFNPESFALGGVIKAVNSEDDENNLLYISVNSEMPGNIARVETVQRDRFISSKKKKIPLNNFEEVSLSSLKSQKPVFKPSCNSSVKRKKSEVEGENWEEKEEQEEPHRKKIFTEQSYEYPIEKNPPLNDYIPFKNSQFMSLALGDWRPSKIGPLSPVIEEPELEDEDFFKNTNSSNSCLEDNKTVTLEGMEARNDSLSEHGVKSEELCSDSTLHNCPSLDSSTWSENELFSNTIQDFSSSKNKLIDSSLTRESNCIIGKEKDSIEISSQETLQEVTIHINRESYFPAQSYQQLQSKPWRLNRYTSSSEINRRHRQIKIQQDNAVNKINKTLSQRKMFLPASSMK